MRNTIIFSVVLFIAVVAASIFYFNSLDQEHNLAAKPLRYLPDSTFLIVATHNNEISDNIFKDFEVFDALIGFKKMNQLSEFKNNILRNEELGRYIQDADLYFSFHEIDKNTEMIITVPTTTSITDIEITSILQTISKKYKINKTDTLGHNFYTIQFGTQDSSLYSVYYNNILFSSYSMPLLAKIVDKSTKRIPEEQIDFFLKNNSRNTPLSVYFSHQQFSEIVNLYQQKTTGAFLNLFRKLQGQSAWNINFKQDALILTGESSLDQYPENYISIFKNQQKKTQQLYNYFPANTAVYMEYSLSNPATFEKDLKDLFKRRKEKIEEETDTTTLTREIQTALGSDFAFIETTDQNYIGFIRLKDIDAWNKIQSKAFDQVNDTTYRFRSTNLLYKQYGDVFKEFPKPYVTQIDSILVFANSSSTVRSYRKDWQQRNLLVGTLGFKNFEKIQGNEANITFFIHNKNANSKIQNSLNQPFNSNYKDQENYGFQDFYSWSFQLSGNKDSFSSQIYAMYKSKSALGVTPEWTYSLNNKAITKPYVFDYADTSKFILIQELDHTIHAILPSGKKLWSGVFSGRVVGEIQQLADRTIILATDRNRLYRIDTSGKYLDGFSVSLQGEPIATPSIVSLGGKKIILVSTKNEILAYGMDGKQIKEWSSPSIAGNFTGPIQQIGENFVVSNNTNKVYFLDQKGIILKSYDTKGNFQVQNNLGIYQKENNQYTVFATDTASSVYLLSMDQRASKFTFDKITGTHFSDFKNMTGSSAPEMIILRNNQLRVYQVQDTARLIYEYYFTKAIKDPPQYFESSSTSGLYTLGVASKSTNLIYMFDEKGFITNGFPVEGQPLFHYGKINNNNDIYLLTMRRDHKLYAFRHQK